MNAPPQMLDNGLIKLTYSGSYLPIMGIEGAFFSRPADVITLSVCFALSFFF